MPAQSKAQRLGEEARHLFSSFPVRLSDATPPTDSRGSISHFLWLISNFTGAACGLRRS
jgi:hypothetical protein